MEFVLASFCFVLLSLIPFSFSLGAEILEAAVDGAVVVVVVVVAVVVDAGAVVVDVEDETVEVVCVVVVADDVVVVVAFSICLDLRVLVVVSLSLSCFEDPVALA